ncbi:MAG: hypothetical protein ACLTDR_04725 [Adlercreutzia equolifaciens]
MVPQNVALFEGAHACGRTSSFFMCPVRGRSARAGARLVDEAIAFVGLGDWCSDSAHAWLSAAAFCGAAQHRHAASPTEPRLHSSKPEPTGGGESRRATTPFWASAALNAQRLHRGRPPRDHYAGRDRRDLLTLHHDRSDRGRSVAVGANVGLKATGGGTASASIVEVAALGDASARAPGLASAPCAARDHHTEPELVVRCELGRATTSGRCAGRACGTRGAPWSRVYAEPPTP